MYDWSCLDKIENKVSICYDNFKFVVFYFFDHLTILSIKYLNDIISLCRLMKIEAIVLFH